MPRFIHSVMATFPHLRNSTLWSAMARHLLQPKQSHHSHAPTWRSVANSLPCIINNMDFKTVRRTQRHHCRTKTYSTIILCAPLHKVGRQFCHQWMETSGSYEPITYWDRYKIRADKLSDMKWPPATCSAGWVSFPALFLFHAMRWRERRNWWRRNSIFISVCSIRFQSKTLYFYCDNIFLSFAPSLLKWPCGVDKTLKSNYPPPPTYPPRNPGLWYCDKSK